MKKPVLISGVQPTGKLHIGNYLGALKNFVYLQNSGKYECYFFIADLHSLTEDFNPKEKPKQILDLAVDFLASGLDPKKSIIFVQSQIPAHSELAWILNTITPVSELLRMIQFRSKAFGKYYGKEGIPTPTDKADTYTKKLITLVEQDAAENANTGLLTYPALMAADILLYKPKVVPVGDDQVQHLEFTRTLARKFNSRFGKTFIEPKAILTEVPRLMSLDNSEKKMSKSRPAGCLFLDDSPEEMREKIKSAVTDSGREVKYDPKSKPAVSSLLSIYKAFSRKSIKDIEKKYKGKGYADFKKDLAEIVVNYFKSFQKKKRELEKDQNKIRDILRSGAKKARPVAEKTMLEARRRIGLI